MKKESSSSLSMQAYGKAYRHYCKNLTKTIDPLMRSLTKTCPLATKYPIYRVCKAISRVFLLNEIEAAVMFLLVRESRWNIDHHAIMGKHAYVKDIVCCPNDTEEYRRVILYLLLAGYACKYALNSESSHLLEEVNKMCVNFKSLFERWIEDYIHIIESISPRSLNAIYKNITTDRSHSQSDLNLMTDFIIQMSPAYNSDKQDRTQLHQDHKQQLKHLTKQTKHIFSKEINLKEWNPFFSTSRVREMMNGEPEISAFHVFERQEISLNNRFLGGFANSIAGVMGFETLNVELRDEDDCMEFDIGVNEGESNEVVMLDTSQANDLQSQFLSLNRGISVTSKYLSLHESENMKIVLQDSLPGIPDLNL